MISSALLVLAGAAAGAGVTAVLLRRRRAAPGAAGPTEQATRLAEVGQRLAEVAHELSNPLSAILAFAQDLLRADPTPEQREALLVIQQQARRSRKLVRGLLEDVHAAPAPAPLMDPAALIAAVAPVFEREGERHGISFTVTADPHLPALEGDAPGMEQVLTNLLRNAFQATPRGGRVSLLGRVRGRLLEFVVQDSGPGIPPEHLPRLFEPFFTTKSSGEGTGLGLSVSQTIVRRHRGTLVGENLPAWEEPGARFTVSLPFVDRRRQDREPPEEEPDGAAGPSGRRALLIEDDAAVRHALRRYLERFAWVVEEAGDGAAGRDRAMAQPWDLIICDLQLPSLSGMAIHEQVRAGDETKAARFLLISGDVSRPEVQSFRRRTGALVLEKPVELSALSHALRRLLQP